MVYEWGNILSLKVDSSKNISLYIKVLSAESHLKIELFWYNPCGWTFQVVLGFLLFPSILFLEFKSKEELQLMPQTMEEHIQELEDSDSDISSISSSDSSDDSQSEVGGATLNTPARTSPHVRAAKYILCVYCCVTHS